MSGHDQGYDQGHDQARAASQRPGPQLPSFPLMPTLRGDASRNRGRGASGGKVLHGWQRHAPLSSFVFQSPLKERERIVGIAPNGVTLNRNHEPRFKFPVFRQSHDILDVRSLVITRRSQAIDQLLFKIR